MNIIMLMITLWLSSSLSSLHRHHDHHLYYYNSSTAQVVPSWNVTIINKTSTSLTVRWSNFPSSVPIQHLLVKYKDKNSNASLAYNVSNWYNSHYTGNVLKVYMFYEVYVVAVSSVNGTLYSSEAMTARTNEGGKYAKTYRAMLTSNCGRTLRMTILLNKAKTFAFWPQERRVFKVLFPFLNAFFSIWNFRLTSLNLVFQQKCFFFFWFAMQGMRDEILRICLRGRLHWVWRKTKNEKQNLVGDL